MTINFVQIDTSNGIKEFELVEGDITNLSFHIDLLCISAFKNDYTPTHKSIIGQLFKKGINVSSLSISPFMDFRDTLGVWVSECIDDEKFKRIICTEVLGTGNSVSEAIRNLFAVVSILEVKGECNESIALPDIATGEQSLSKEMVISSLIEISLDFLKHSRHLKKVFFVVRADKAFEFNEKMNDALGRVKVKSPRGKMASILKKDLNTNIDALSRIHSEEEVFKDLKRVINTEFRSFEFGAITRKSIEKIIEKLNPESKKQYELIKKIESLHLIGISQWIQSYFHTIRVFGNEAVHVKNENARFPKYVDERDLEIGMYCMSRIIEFYISQIKIDNFNSR